MPFLITPATPDQIDALALAQLRAHEKHFLRRPFDAVWRNDVLASQKDSVRALFAAQHHITAARRHDDPAPDAPLCGFLAVDHVSPRLVAVTHLQSCETGAGAALLQDFLRTQLTLCAVGGAARHVRLQSLTELMPYYRRFGFKPARLAGEYNMTLRL